ncbi:hypothetical protein [Neobacillus sp. YIM B06451]|uniref:hypothetical protein n=1 Tax=Neobacillus sp. YIM B06451 TaxID=3070994 RepID=UPI002930D8E6|nr:hypothetical protein [Neobacillus sp. YIM B06451]
MGEALIIGVFERLGFHLCKRLLEMGYEVGGISLSPSPDETEENMELEIGRNSNFVKMPIDAVETHFIGEKVVIFSLYDLYTEGKIPPSHTESLGTKLEELIRLNHQWPLVVLLLPNGPGQRSREVRNIEAIRKAADLAEASAEKVLRVIVPIPSTTGTDMEQTGKKNAAEKSSTLPTAGEEGPDWDKAAERIALLIDKGDTGTRILEGIYPTLNGRG